MKSENFLILIRVKIFWKKSLLKVECIGNILFMEQVAS